MPVTFSYFCEFFSKKTRGPFVIVLAGFWIIGSVFASLLALVVIEPFKSHLKYHLGEFKHKGRSDLPIGLLIQEGGVFL